MEIARNVLIAVKRIGNKAPRSSLPAKNRGSVDVSAVSYTHLTLPTIYSV